MVCQYDLWGRGDLKDFQQPSNVEEYLALQACRHKCDGTRMKCKPPSNVRLPTGHGEPLALAVADTLVVVLVLVGKLSAPI